MKKVLIGIAIVAAIVLAISSLNSEDNSAYVQKVQDEIESRKRYLQFNEQSPFNQFNATYSNPIYYPIDPSYKVMATVNRIEERQIMTIGTSSGEEQRYSKIAWIKFDLKGQEFRLLVLKPYGMGAMDNFFCAFADDTSGESTYGGGRYLDLKIGKSNKVEVDFNLAYNPYCAYVDDYVCPLPPAENILPIAIEAGEKDFK